MAARHSAKPSGVGGGPINPASPLLPPLLPAVAAEGLLLPGLLLLLLSGMTTAGLTGGLSPDSCLLLLLRLTATAEAAGNKTHTWAPEVTRGSAG